MTRTFRRLLPSLSGRVLDVGCGEKPYRRLFDQPAEYVGLDIAAGPQVDIVVQPGERWPLPDAHFDVLISNQVLEHVADLDFTLAEMKRVVKPGGTVVVSIPFIYNEHGSPYDFQRFTVYRARQLFEKFEELDLEKQGGIGSTIAILTL
ncbi:MAG TPA: class I SAM-dependent methyltransferase, partial [Gemmatimonadaceae bacterium]|nr:class I SAM-dependent methyltransferase [Gemmatimonadaceae bacterium]